MAGVLVATPASAEVGSPIVISGTGFTTTDALLVSVSAEAEQGVEVDFPLVCVAGVMPSFTVVPGGPGHFNVAVVDTTTPANNPPPLRVTTFED
jgi:hypothetical protein